jgi:hypothetical protein
MTAFDAVDLVILFVYPDSTANQISFVPPRPDGEHVA